MLDLLRYVNARFGEASTYASLAALLLAAHVNLDPGLAKQLMLWGMIGSGGIAVILSEVGAKPGSQIAADVLAAIIAGVKQLPDQASKAATAMLLLLAGTSLLMLNACAPAAAGAGAGAAAIGLQVVNGINTAVQDGQLFCAVATQTGPIVMRIVDAANGGKPVIIIGQSAQRVADICAALNGGVPVVPPANPAAAPVAAVAVTS